MDKKTFITVLVHLALVAQGHKKQKDEEEIYYRFWTDKMGEEKFVDIKNTSAEKIIPVLDTAGFDPNAKTKIVFHGISQSAPHIWKKYPFQTAYLTAKKRVNLFIVDWSETAKLPRYVDAANSVEKVGERICRQLIRPLIKAEVNSSNIHLIGFSLGSYVAASVSRQCLNGQAERITALDPAENLISLFLNANSHALSKHDAKFVDVIHTNGGHLLQGCFGRTDELGHVDFFINTKTKRKQLSGSFRFDNQHQPGCNDLSWSNFFKLVSNTSSGIACSHLRALDYYLESIVDEDAFEGRQCSEWEKKYFWLFHYANECIKAGSFKLYLGENLDTEKALKLKGDKKFFLTTTDGKNGKYSKDKFEL